MRKGRKGYSHATTQRRNVVTKSLPHCCIQNKNGKKNSRNDATAQRGNKELTSLLHTKQKRKEKLTQRRNGATW
jgi:hypothetical protein